MWPESASELYRPSDRRLSAKSVPAFADRGLSHSQRSRSPMTVISVFCQEPLLFLSSSSSIVLMRLSGSRSKPTASQANLVAAGNRTRTSGSIAKNSDHRTTEAVHSICYLLYSYSV
jgi:hypothetical protein